MNLETNDSSYSGYFRVITGVLNKIEEETEEYLTDDNILELYSIFGPLLERALQIVSRSESIIVYTDENNLRAIAEVGSQKHSTYYLFVDINYCTCASFQYHVLKTKVRLTCKHVLALRLGRITGNVTYQTVTEQQYSLLYCSVFTREEVVLN